MPESIYRKARMFAKTTFTGQEQHQELRLKIVKLSKTDRELIVSAAEFVSGKKLKTSEAIYWLLNDLKKIANTPAITNTIVE
jgi:hypothetical protein